MRYFICGLTINGAHFWVNEVYEHQIEDERAKVASTVAYFGGGSVTVYGVDYKNDVSIESFEKIDGNPEIFLDNEEIYC